MKNCNFNSQDETEFYKAISTIEDVEIENAIRTFWSCLNSQIYSKYKKMINRLPLIITYNYDNKAWLVWNVAGFGSVNIIFYKTEGSKFYWRIERAPLYLAKSDGKLNRADDIPNALIKTLSELAN